MQSIKDKPKKRCPKCGKHRLERVIYGGIYGFVENTNTHERSKLEAEEKEKSLSKNPLGISKYGSKTTATTVEINRMSEIQKKNYIVEGKK